MRKLELTLYLQCAAEDYFSKEQNSKENTRDELRIRVLETKRKQ